MAAVTLQIPRGSHGKIIGKGGATIRGLQEQHNVRIQIPQEGTGVMVSGPVDAVEACRRAMEQALGGFSLSDQPLARAEIDVQPVQYGSLIGPGGSVLRDLEQKSGASITIPSRGTQGPVVAEGTAAAVKKAIQAIKALAPTADVRGQTTSVAADAAPSRDIDLLTKAPVNEVLFFPETAEGHPNFNRFVQYLMSAKRTLDICVFTLSDNTIAAAILRAHAAKASVRVLTDNDTAANEGSDIGALRAAGIRVAQDRSPAHMHHKFAILDGKILINGSFNWTRSAATANCENIVITNSPDLVRPFQAEFDRLWRMYA